MSQHLIARQEAFVELGAAVRALAQAVVDTEADDAVLGEAARLARRAAELLTATTRPPNRFSSAEDRVLTLPGARIFSPVVGAANPVSPPVTIVDGDGEALRLEATCILHRVHEGPPTFGHGGVSAMLLDQVLGQAVMLTGRVGLTRSLVVRYRRPVPLGVPLVLSAEVTRLDGTRATSSGRIATRAEPDVVLVEADGVFLVPRPDQVGRLFSHVESGRVVPLPTGD